jgi:H+-translocating NAD(P) transhydrogenase subunit alpha
MQFKGITIGVPREIMPGEKRVAAIPFTVEKMVTAGAEVLVETEAGAGAFISDDDYREKGAEIVNSPVELYERANMIIKVKELRQNTALEKHEAEMIKAGSTLIGFMHPAHSVNHSGIKILAERNVTSYTLDGIPRISKAQQMDALTSMSTVAGYKAVIFAAGHLGRFIPMMPTSSGVIPPAQFLVIGTGVAGLQAIATAKRLGAKVKTIDIRSDANEQARSLGAENIDFDIPRDIAVGQGGYARRLSEDWYAREREVLTTHFAQSDAVILSALIPGEVAPLLVNEAMVNSMKKGSVIVDIAVDQGGNCELTCLGEDIDHNGVTISGIMNIPAALPIDSTRMFAQNLWHFISHLVENGQVKTDLDDEIISATLVTNNQQIVHHGTLLAMNIN